MGNIKLFNIKMEITNSEIIFEPNFWKSGTAYFLYINAILGLIMFELAYARFKRFPEMNTRYAHINDKFPAFKRTDTREWARWKFWPGAMTLFLPRFAFIMACNTLLAAIGYLLLIKHT